MRKKTKPDYHFVSYPKSGRTWIRFILTQLDYAKDIKFHHDSFEFNDGSKPPHDFDMNHRLKDYSKVDKLVYLERDPRDVMVSLYHQVTGRFKDFFHYEKDISSFICDEYFGAENLKRFREMWETLCSTFNFLKVTYEECHEDIEKVIIRILTYYDTKIDPEVLEKTIENARFENMRKVEESESFEYPWLRPRNQSPKVRRGKIGGFADELSTDDVAYLNNIFGL